MMEAYIFIGGMILGMIVGIFVGLWERKSE